MVDTAKRLLVAARAMSEAAEAKSAAQAKKDMSSPKDNTLLSRLNEHQRLAHEAMKYDLTRLARAQV
jgi:hypothetical protein